LCRWAGLRRGEALSLRWADVDWQGNRLRVNAEVERETTKRRRRTAPIEPARCPSGLYALLRAAFEAAPAGSVRVCEGLSENNVRRSALAILRRSSVGAYAKPFHTLRKCCETDWAQGYPQHVVCEWLGHGLAVSQAHYLRVPVELYDLPGTTKGLYDPSPEARPTTAILPPQNARKA
jgi:integrase